ncbi:MAG: DUF4340 domain-containing protein [Clostridia bacterium]|nr:DUF4340 domain-containing protein [Clostridia bacterium]
MVPEKKTIDTQNEIEALEQTPTVNDESLFEQEVKNSTVLTEKNGMERANDRKVRPLFERRFITIIALFVAIVVFVSGTICVNIFIKEETEEEQKTTDSTIVVKQTEAESIEKIIVNGSYGEVVFVSVKDGSTYTWELQGYDKALVASSSVNAAANSLASITATRVMEEDQSKKSIYGLNKPTVVAKVFSRKGEDYTITVGDASPDGSGYYASVTGDPKIYLLSAGTVNNFNTSPEAMAETVIIPTQTIENVAKRSDKKYFDEETGSLATFDSIELSGPRYGQKAVITPIADNEFVEYNIDLGSYSRYADPTIVEEMFSITANSLVAIDTYALHPDEATIKKYGLAEPELSVAIKYGSTTISFKASMYDYEQLYYAVMVDGRDAIYAVTADALSMLQNDLEKYYYRFVFQEFIYKFKTMTVETPDKTYAFDILHNPSDDTFTARSNGVKVDDALLSTYYQYFLTLSPVVKPSYTDGEVALKATFNYNSESKGQVVIELVKQSARRYLVRINGNDYGIVNSSDYDHLVAYAEYVMIDKGIPEP